MTGKGRNSVADLIAKSPLGGRSLALGNVTLAEAEPVPITSLAPFNGRLADVDAVLRGIGLAFPAANRFHETASHRIVWSGRGQAFLFGPPPAGLADAAASTDQSDGWAALTLVGPDAAAALMRLVPLDLRARAFPPGTAARAPLNHMQAILLCTAPDAFLLLVFRSMATTAWHELETALKSLAARARLSA